MNKDILDFIADGLNYSNYDWKTSAQAYGILSRFAFIANRHEENMGDEELNAFRDAERTLFEDDEINAKAFRTLIGSIENWTGSKYKLDILDQEDEMSRAKKNREETIKDLVKQIVDLIEE